MQSMREPKRLELFQFGHSTNRKSFTAKTEADRAYLRLAQISSLTKTSQWYLGLLGAIAF
jgi:hypothetical protein